MSEQETKQNGVPPMVTSSSKVSLVTPGVYYPNYLHLKYPRAVLKNGQFNIYRSKAVKQLKFLSNWFICMVECQWRWTLILFFSAYVCNWLFFGFVYWMVAMSHGDLQNDVINQNETEHIPCIENIYGFTSSFLFSVEVHTTVAYGRRAITLECPQAIIAMCIQCITSSIFQAFMVGILFAKLIRPKARTQTILFSKHAVISMRDEKLCLIFRVGDMRKSKILNISASMYVLRLSTDSQTIENDEQIELKTEIDGCESSFFLWPVSVVHIIDEKSPLFKVSAADLLCGRIEIVVVFEGIIESTGQPVQARSSFTENDILWGHRLVPMVNYDDDSELFGVDYSKLHLTEQVDTPLCSASEYEAVVSLIQFVNSDINSDYTNVEE